MQHETPEGAGWWGVRGRGSQFVVWLGQSAGTLEREGATEERKRGSRATCQAAYKY